MYDALAIKQVRNMYVFKCLNLKQIAKILDLPYRTVSRWKSDAKKNGDCWTTARSNSLISSGGTDDLDVLLNEFVTLFNATMDEVKSSSNISALDKVNAISSMGDAYAKVVKSASKTDPAKTQLAIALDAIKHLIEYLNTVEEIEVVKKLVPHLKAFGDSYKIKVHKDGKGR